MKLILSFLSILALSLFLALAAAITDGEYCQNKRPLAHGAIQEFVSNIHGRLPCNKSTITDRFFSSPSARTSTVSKLMGKTLLTSETMLTLLLIALSTRSFNLR